MNKRLFVGGMFFLSFTVACGAVTASWDTIKEKVKEKVKEKIADIPKDVGKEVAKERAHEWVDRHIKGGDNKPAKAIVDAVLDGNPWKAFGTIVLSPSEISPNQDLPSPVVLPSDGVIFDEPGWPDEQVSEKPVVPANPSNENAVPARGSFDKLIERDVIPPLPPDVGRTIVVPDHSGDRGQGGHGGGAERGGGWAGPDHPDHASHIA